MINEKVLGLIEFNFHKHNLIFMSPNIPKNNRKFYIVF